MWRTKAGVSGLPLRVSRASHKDTWSPGLIHDRPPTDLLALEYEQLLTQHQDQAIAVGPGQTRDEHVQGSQEYRQRMLEHGDRMTPGQVEVNCQHVPGRDESRPLRVS